MSRLKSAFPQRDPMELQDILRSHSLNLEAALQAVSCGESPARSPNSKHGKVISQTVPEPYLPNIYILVCSGKYPLLIASRLLWSKPLDALSVCYYKGPILFGILLLYWIYCVVKVRYCPVLVTPVF